MSWDFATPTTKNLLVVSPSHSPCRCRKTRRIELKLPHTDEGLRAAIEIRRRYPNIAVLVLSQYVEERYAGELLEGDVSGVGYLLKDRVIDVEDFLVALRRAQLEQQRVRAPGLDRAEVGPEALALREGRVGEAHARRAVAEHVAADDPRQEVQRDPAARRDDPLRDLGHPLYQDIEIPGRTELASQLESISQQAAAVGPRVALLSRL